MNCLRPTLAALLLAALATGCIEPTSDPLSPDLPLVGAAEASPRVYVLNTQLRGIIDPEIEPSPAWGHVRIKLTDDGAEGYAVKWSGKLFNPERSTFNSGFIIDPDIMPDGDEVDGLEDHDIVIGGELVFTFFRDSGSSCDILSFDSQGITDEEHIPADVAQRMIAGPDLFRAVLLATDGSLVLGTFSHVDPTTILGFNPQPDPPQGKQTRCAA